MNILDPKIFIYFNSLCRFAVRVCARLLKQTCPKKGVASEDQPNLGREQLQLGHRQLHKLFLVWRVQVWRQPLVALNQLAKQELLEIYENTNPKASAILETVHLEVQSAIFGNLFPTGQETSCSWVVYTWARPNSNKANAANANNLLTSTLGSRL